MKLTTDDVLKLGSLSRIAIDEETLPVLQEDLNRILEFASVLQEVDPQLPAYEFDMGGNILRADTVTGEGGQKQATALAPASQDGFLKVPRTVDSDANGA